MKAKLYCKPNEKIEEEANKAMFQNSGLKVGNYYKFIGFIGDDEKEDEPSFITVKNAGQFPVTFDEKYFE